MFRDFIAVGRYTPKLKLNSYLKDNTLKRITSQQRESKQNIIKQKIVYKQKIFTYQ